CARIGDYYGSSKDWYFDVW
nr:immunoglobulin heavy chain junction region [Mus musculus]MBK4198000.1 immunoglobulin heavy chain junction region [Mus musculus]MBK4198001.1 immunoglobulin heavy chain junction region [Mus musculus]MBK4198002.1 immunoglobulin heavy chain junction region [Mus musculus]MBK4198003.1 immunoglobulin heavy chain junction region [Mus musculus]